MARQTKQVEDQVKEYFRKALLGISSPYQEIETLKKVTTQVFDELSNKVEKRLGEAFWCGPKLESMVFDKQTEKLVIVISDVLWLRKALAELTKGLDNE